MDYLVDTDCPNPPIDDEDELEKEVLKFPKFINPPISSLSNPNPLKFEKILYFLLPD